MRMWVLSLYDRFRVRVRGLLYYLTTDIKPDHNPNTNRNPNPTNLLTLLNPSVWWCMTSMGTGKLCGANVQGSRLTVSEVLRGLGSVEMLNRICFCSRDGNRSGRPAPVVGWVGLPVGSGRCYVTSAWSAGRIKCRSKLFQVYKPKTEIDLLQSLRFLIFFHSIKCGNVDLIDINQHNAV